MRGGLSSIMYIINGHSCPSEVVLNKGWFMTSGFSRGGPVLLCT